MLQYVSPFFDAYKNGFSRNRLLCCFCVLKNRGAVWAASCFYVNFTLAEWAGFGGWRSFFLFVTEIQQFVDAFHQEEQNQSHNQEVDNR